MIDLPEPVAELARALTAMPGAVAVAFGGSRALRLGDARSDWDFGLYYRGTIVLAALTAWGTVHPPGAFGRLVNGGLPPLRGRERGRGPARPRRGRALDTARGPGGI
jgi:hypothetical protein